MMKRLLLFVLSFVLLNTSFANPPSALGFFSKDLKNSIKINLAPIFFKSYSFQYERIFLRNFSVCAQVGYGSELQLSSYANNIMDKVPNERLEKIRAKIALTELYTTNNMYFTPEVRVYISFKGAPKGLYIAPYLRFSSSNVNATFLYKDSNNNEVPIKFTGRLQSIHPGAMIGYQKIFFKRIVLDFWLLGLHFGSSNASFDAYADYKKVDKEGFINFVQDNFKYGNATVTIESDEHAKIDFEGKLIGYRSGFCLGFRF